MSLQPNDVIDGKYTIIRQIGKGGMGAVFEGENQRIHRRVAIKVLHASVAGDRSFVQRFEREAQAAGRIGSDHIVEVLDLGDLPSGDRYMVMEFLEGETLRARMKTLRKMTPDEIFPIVAELLDGLAEAHGAGIIHRDLKPDNIFLVLERKWQTDFVKILDFGVSKFRTLGTESVTHTGVMLGTPHYMSPEQAKGEKAIDHRADLYSVGVILYKALTGKNPFSGDNFNELMFKVVLEDAPPISTHVPDVDSRVVDIVSKAMARRPDDRFSAADEFAGALRGWLNDNGFQVSFQRPIRTGRGSFTSSGRSVAVEAAPDSSEAPTRESALEGASNDEQSLSTKMTSSSVVSAIKLPRHGVGRYVAVALLAVVGLAAALVFILASPTKGTQNAASAKPSATVASTSAAQPSSAALAASTTISKESASTSLSAATTTGRPRVGQGLRTQTRTAPAAATPASKSRGQPSAQPSTPPLVPSVGGTNTTTTRKYRTAI